MSNAFAITAVFILAVAFAVIGGVFVYRLSKRNEFLCRKVKEAYERIDEWKAIATRLLTENQDWTARFRHLVIFIWGDPPLDRSVEDVCDFISNLRAGQGWREKAETLTLAYVILDDKLRETESRLKSASAEVEARNRELAATEGALRRNLEALCRVTTNQESLRRFQDDREAFMREIEGLRSDVIGSHCKVCGAACPF